MSKTTITLYHGTTFDYDEIDVRRGKPFKDFGQGFYATQSRESAINIALRIFFGTQRAADLLVLTGRCMVL